MRDQHIIADPGKGNIFTKNGTKDHIRILTGKVGKNVFIEII
jgi:hypothetical protein